MFDMVYRDDSERLRARVRELEAEQLEGFGGAVRRKLGAFALVAIGLALGVAATVGGSALVGSRAAWARRPSDVLGTWDRAPLALAAASRMPADETGFVPNVQLAPLLVGGRLISWGDCAASGRRLLAARAHDEEGRVTWTSCAVAGATGQVHAARAGSSIIVATGAELVGLDDDGRLLWRQSRKETAFRGSTVVGSFVVGGAHLGGEDGGPMTSRLQLLYDDVSDWQWTTSAPHGSWIVDGNSRLDPRTEVPGVRVLASGYAHRLGEFVIGKRSTGPLVGVVARIDSPGPPGWSRVMWTAEFPVIAREGWLTPESELPPNDPTPKIVATSEDAVFVVHEEEGISKLSRLDPATGERRWTVDAAVGAASWNMDRMTTDGARVYVMAAIGVIVFAASDGRILYKLP